MLLSRHNFSWLKPVAGSSLYHRQKACGVLSMILLLAELLILIYGSYQCGSPAHWTMFTGCCFALVVLLLSLASLTWQKLEEPKPDCDWYHELYLIGMLAVASQIAFCFGFVSVIRAYPFMIRGNSTKVVELLAAVDWIFSAMSMFIFGVALFSYLLLTTREPKKT